MCVSWGGGGGGLTTATFIVGYLSCCGCHRFPFQGIQPVSFPFVVESHCVFVVYANLSNYATKICVYSDQYTNKLSPESLHSQVLVNRKNVDSIS